MIAPCSFGAPKPETSKPAFPTSLSLVQPSLIPVITVTGLQLGSIIAFSVITETVFQWPGMGLMFIQAVTFGDIPVMSAYLVLVALLFVLINLTVDLLYFAVDPRVRAQMGAHHGA
jgi:peptide/nickel transport system permease protein